MFSQLGCTSVELGMNEMCDQKQINDCFSLFVICVQQTLDSWAPAAPPSPPPPEALVLVLGLLANVTFPLSGSLFLKKM